MSFLFPFPLLPLPPASTSPPLLALLGALLPARVVDQLVAGLRRRRIAWLSRR